MQNLNRGYWIMLGKELFLKTDNRGRKQPTFLTWGLIGLFIVCSSLFSHEKKPHYKSKAQQSILKEKDVIEAANSSLKDQGTSFNLDYAQTVQTSQQNNSQLNESTLRNFRPAVSVPTKMIVFDDTKDFKSKRIVPLGSMVNCLLIHNIVTNNFEAPVIVQVWEDFYFDGKLLLPFGTRIYGTASAERERDRVTVKFHDIVFQDGKTIKIHAIGLSQDGSGGLTGTVINDTTKKTIIGMALNLLSGMALGFQQTATNVVTGINQVEANSRNALLNGVANTFQKQAQQVQTEVENSKGYAIVLAGTPMVVYFEEESDMQAN
jgi:Bacterial conjugation TrbI-like protein